MRGNGDSEGLMLDEYSKQELDDAEFTVNWLAAQTCVAVMLGRWVQLGWFQQSSLPSAHLTLLAISAQV